MLEVILAVAVLTAWAGFLWAVKRGRNVQDHTAAFRRLGRAFGQVSAAFAGMGLAASKAAKAMEEFNRQYAEAVAKVRVDG